MRRIFLLPCWSLLLAASLLPVAEAADTPADVLRLLLPAAAGGLTFLHDDAEGRLQFSKSFLSTVGATYLLKVAIDAERPNGGGRSFPSGHASMAFSGASFIQQRYGWDYGAPAYLAASFVGWRRVDSGDHRLGEVLAGAALGIACTHLFTDRFGRSGWQLKPMAAETAVGLVLEGFW